MKATEMKTARLALALVLALLCAVFVALPTLAMAENESEENLGTNPSDISAEQTQDLNDSESVVLKDGGNEVFVQSATMLDGAVLQIQGSGEFDPSGVESGIATLIYQPDESSTPVSFSKESNEFTIKGYMLQEGTAPSSVDAATITNTPSTSGSYYVIVNIHTTNTDDSVSTYSGWGYAAFTVTSPSGTPTGGGQGDGPGQGPGGNQGPSLHVELLQQEYAYTGQPVNVQISSVVSNGTQLSASDYKIAGYQRINEGSAPTNLPAEPAPSEAGRYKVIVQGVGSYAGKEGTPEFSIVKANSLSSKNNVSITTDRAYYVLENGSVRPKVTVTFAGIPLVEVTDYTVCFLKQDGPNSGQLVDTITQGGQYLVKVQAVEGGLYSDSGMSTQPFEVVSDSNNLKYATLSFADSATYGNPTVNPTVTWANNSATPPAMVVTSAAGTVLKQDTHFKFQFKKSDSEDWKDAINDGEGQYSARAVAINGGGYTGESEAGRPGGTLMFYVAAESHDISKADVTLPEEFTWNNDAEITDDLKAKLAVKLGGKDLTVDEDFDISHRSPNNWRPGTGVLGTHTLYLMGNMTSSARKKGNESPQITGDKYYGTKEITYGVWNDEAPAADQRVDVATGVKAQGSTISENSTIKIEEWVSFEAAKLDDAALEAAPAAKKAKDSAVTSGANEVLVYSAALEHTTPNGVTTSMTEDLDIALSFPVDAKYNGQTATITQIHDGVAMEPKTVTVANGMATVKTDRLSEFVISVSEAEKAAVDDKTSNAKGAPAGKTKAAKTGDALPLMVIVGLAIVAAAAAGVVVVSRTRARR